MEEIFKILRGERKQKEIFCFLEYNKLWKLFEVGIKINNAL